MAAEIEVMHHAANVAVRHVRVQGAKDVLIRGRCRAIFSLF